MSHPDTAQSIALLDTVFDQQRAAFSRQPFTSVAERVDLLRAIAPMMMGYAKRLAEALNDDYGYHSPLTAYMFDVLNVAGRAEYVANNLPRWVLPEQREVVPHLYGESRAYTDHQAKGVVGNLSAWNFPVDLSIGPLCEMLAAGNRVIIKPSEQVPATAEVMAEMVAATFDRDRVAVVTGDLELAEAFTTKPWDHLLYTGNSNIGRKVMSKAAANLVPVTLELGGKSPTVFTREAVTATNVRSLLGAKLIKGGQLCITVDHVYVPNDQLDSLVELIDDSLKALMGDHTTSDMGVAVINQRQFQRAQRVVDDAKQRHPDAVVELGSATHAERPYRMPLTLIINPEPDSLACQEELFGPVLPIFGYDDFDEVVVTINRGERPLGVYIFSDDNARIEQLRRNTVSGGFAVNAPSMQGAHESLGFGGVGNSGMGRHHGYDGFREFSNPRGVFELGAGAQTDLLYAPHGEMARAFIEQVSGGLLPGDE